MWNFYTSESLNWNVLEKLSDVIDIIMMHASLRNGRKILIFESTKKCCKVARWFNQLLRISRWFTSCKINLSSTNSNAKSKRNEEYSQFTGKLQHSNFIWLCIFYIIVMQLWWIIATVKSKPRYPLQRLHMKNTAAATRFYVLNRAVIRYPSISLTACCLQVISN